MLNDNNNQGESNGQKDKPQGIFSNFFSSAGQQQHQGSLFGSQGANASKAQSLSLFGNSKPTLFGNSQQFAQPSAPTQSLFQSGTNQQFKQSGGFFSGLSQPSNQQQFPNFGGSFLGIKDEEEEETCEQNDTNQVYESYWKPKIPNKELTPIQQFKVVIVGDGGVGKTGFVKNLLGMEFPEKYIATIGTEITPLPLMTNYGLFSFSIWDTAGQDKFGGLREGYYLSAHCAIIMFDLTSKITYKSIPKWHKDITRICMDIPKVLVGNKAEMAEATKINDKSIQVFKKFGMSYCEISSKTGYQCEKPLLYLLRMLKNNSKIELLEEPVPQPEEPPTLTEEEIQELIESEENVEDVPLPDCKENEFRASSEGRDD